MTDEASYTPQTCIQHAAFEAAYLEMTPPDLASRRFAELVAKHRKRLWVEHLTRQGEQPPAAPPASQTDEPRG